MLSEKQLNEVSAKQEQSLSEQASDEIFRDLEGVGEVEFYTARDGQDTAEDTSSEDSDAIDENILAEDYDEPEYDDDPPMEMPEGGLAVDEDVLEVLRSEAALSSSRTNNLSDNIEPEESRGNSTENAFSEEPEADDLTTFLDAHSSEAEAGEAPVEPPIEDTPAEEPVSAEPPSFDPLSDLNAIRSQLSDITEDDTDYRAILPEDDPVETTETEAPDLLEDDDIAAVMAALDGPESDVAFETEPDQIDETSPAVAKIPDNIEEEGEGTEPELDVADFDDFDEAEPRRVFRADGAGQAAEDMDSPEPESFGLSDEFFKSEPVSEEPVKESTDSDLSGSAIPAAAALGAMRPRSSGGKARVRSITAAEDLQPLTPNEDTEAVPQSMSRPVRPAKGERSQRPQTEETIEKPVSRKDLLPDVEELNSTLRGEAPVLQNKELAEATEESPAAKSFFGSFAKTLLFLALVVALYVMRPMIVSAIPTAAVVLDPYVAFIDSIRLWIENTINNLRS